MSEAADKGRALLPSKPTTGTWSGDAESLLEMGRLPQGRVRDRPLDVRQADSSKRCADGAEVMGMSETKMAIVFNVDPRDSSVGIFADGFFANEVGSVLWCELTSWADTFAHSRFTWVNGDSGEEGVKPPSNARFVERALWAFKLAADDYAAGVVKPSTAMARTADEPASPVMPTQAGPPHSVPSDVEATAK